MDVNVDVDVDTPLKGFRVLCEKLSTNMLGSARSKLPKEKILGSLSISLSEEDDTDKDGRQSGETGAVGGSDDEDSEVEDEDDDDDEDDEDDEDNDRDNDKGGRGLVSKSSRNNASEWSERFCRAIFSRMGFFKSIL